MSPFLFDVYELRAPTSGTARICLACLRHSADVSTFFRATTVASLHANGHMLAKLERCGEQSGSKGGTPQLKNDAALRIDRRHKKKAPTWSPSSGETQRSSAPLRQLLPVLPCFSSFLRSVVFLSLSRPAGSFAEGGPIGLEPIPSPLGGAALGGGGGGAASDGFFCGTLGSTDWLLVCANAHVELATNSAAATTLASFISVSLMFEQSYLVESKRRRKGLRASVTVGERGTPGVNPSRPGSGREPAKG